MALRFIEIYHREGKADDIDFLLKDLPIIETWHGHLNEDKESITKVLIKSEDTESALNILNEFFTKDKEIRIVILPVEATLPRPKESDEDQSEKKAKEKTPQRISIEELYFPWQQLLLTASWQHGR